MFLVAIIVNLVEPKRIYAVHVRQTGHSLHGGVTYIYGTAASCHIPYIRKNAVHVRHKCHEGVKGENS